MPAIRKADADLDFSGVGKIIRALLNPVATDPGTPTIGEVWFNTADGRLKVRNSSGTQLLATLDDVTAGSITGGLWDAQSVVTAVTDNSPSAQVLAASTVLGRRSTGDITAVTFANLLNDLMAIGAFNTAVDARVTAGITTLVGTAPSALDTLGELSDALGDDPNFAATVTTALGLRTKKFSGNYGNASLTTFTVNHALATTDVIVQARVNATGEVCDCAVDVVDANNVDVSVNTVYGAAALRVVVIG
jgi:hypothetical protein